MLPQPLSNNTELICQHAFELQSFDHIKHHRVQNVASSSPLLCHRVGAGISVHLGDRIGSDLLGQARTFTWTWAFLAPSICTCRLGSIIWRSAKAALAVCCPSQWIGRQLSHRTQVEASGPHLFCWSVFQSLLYQPADACQALRPRWGTGTEHSCGW